MSADAELVAPTDAPRGGDVEMAMEGKGEEVNADLSSLRFQVGDKVLAFHEPLWYYAKILERDPEQGYLVHYDKWSSKWDGWVKAEDIVEVNEANIERMKQVKEEVNRLAAKRSVQAAANGGGNNAGGASGGGGGKRKKVDAGAGGAAGGENDGEEGGDEDGGPEANIRLNLSDELKAIVVRDWDQLTQNKKLCALPRAEERSAERIVDDFLAFKKKSPIYSQVCQGLLIYFDRALPTILLYRCERAQYDRLKSENPAKRPCQLYGGEHLLRLFVRLPQLLVNTDLSEAETKLLCSKLQDLIKFMAKRVAEYFGETGSAYVDESVMGNSAATATNSASEAVEPKTE